MSAAPGEAGPPERVGVIGAGYVGLVTGVCLASLGIEVTLRDIDAAKVAALNDGHVPIYEPGLADLMAEHAERLTYTLSLERLLQRSDVVFIAVDTPPTYSGDADLSRVMGLLDELERVGAEPRHLLVMKSTVPVGTGERVRAELDARGLGAVGYCSNPEFLKEGAAIADFLRPDRVVIGELSSADGDRVAALYAPLGASVVRTSVPSAEMIKYASNAFLATKISFINEIANVCEEVGADVAVVARGMGLDARIGPAFLRAGIGFGGSCLHGDETVLVREHGRTHLTTLEDLFDEVAGPEVGPVETPAGLPGDGLEVLSWTAHAPAPEYRPVAVLTRRLFDGEILEVTTETGRSVACTPDHPLVIRREAVALGVARADELGDGDWLPVALGWPRPHAGLDAGEAIARPGPDALAMPAATTATAVRARDAAGTDASARIVADQRTWRALGRHLARSDDGGRGPHHGARVPDLAWSAPEHHRRALLAGLLGDDGSRSPLGPRRGAVPEHGALSRGLADGILRLLAGLGITADLRVARKGGGAADTYRLVVLGADQVEEPRGPRVVPSGQRRAGGTSWVRVREVRRRRYRGPVYSLEVPGSHTFVTTNGLVVHNCFPKDVAALKQLAGNSGYHFQLLTSVIEVNELQKRRVVGKLKKHLGGLEGKRVALLGLAFKPETDDIREASSLVLTARLLAEGAEVRAYDPVVGDGAGERLRGAVLCESALAAMDGADAAVLVTEWAAILGIDWAAARQSMRTPLLIDGRNALDPEAMRAAGYTFEGIGRAAAR